MNNILNKIAQMERNAEEIQLASHHIELAVTPAQDYAAKSDSLYKDATSKGEANKKDFFSKQAALVKPLNELRPQVYREMMDFISKADDLGLNGKSLPQAKAYEKVISDIDKRVDFFNKEYMPKL
jgi:hypothetical protein